MLSKHASFFPLKYMTNRFNLPNMGYGLGLRSVHYADILEHWPKVDWFEVISENFMDSDGRLKHCLSRIKERYPVVMHGVSLSIGTVDPLNSEYLKKLKSLAAWLNPPWVSDHLCWTGVAHKNTHDLLPVPYTEEALKHIVQRICEVQDFLERPLILENPSTYLEFVESSMPEWEFIARMAEEADCGLLLDINNVYVTCYNHRLDPKTYLDAMPMERVAQIHLAGHSNKGTHIIDTHDGHVIDEVWALYQYVIGKSGFISTMVEWDDEIPEFDVLKAEIDKARALQEKPLPTFSKDTAPTRANQAPPLAKRFNQMQEAILLGTPYDAKPDTWIPPKPDFSPQAQLDVYINAYRYRLFDVVSEDYPAMRHYLGKDAARQLVMAYVNATPSTYYDISRYTTAFPEFVKARSDRFAYELCIMETALSLLAYETETEALKPEHVKNVTPEQLMGQRLYPRKALQLFAFDYPVNDYFKGVMEEKNPAAPAPTPSWLAVYRHDDTMWRLALEKEEYTLLNQLFSGMTVGEALEHLLADATMDENRLLQNLSQWFARWMKNGLLARLPAAVNGDYDKPTTHLTPLSRVRERADLISEQRELSKSG